MEQIRILAPTAILGYGFPLASFAEAWHMSPMPLLWTADLLIPVPIIWERSAFVDRSAVKRIWSSF